MDALNISETVWGYEKYLCCFVEGFGEGSWELLGVDLGQGVRNGIEGDS